ncbi:HAD family hydrolase [Nocardia higoensis]|uniref:HAD family hydrolase n=1 Tax=Nocardia higoensis TaxID=228599 RepID=UPI0003017BAB|nr:haloacid dehalogenase-like hydrolase [Nocardia higoensis]
MSAALDGEVLRDVVVLWDLDHTLLDAGGVDRAVWLDVCAELTGVAPESARIVPGSTIRALLRSLLRQAGIGEDAVDELLPRAIERERELLDARRDRLVRHGRALPGAHAAVEYFAGAAHVTQSVLTGNQIEAARIKLEAYGFSDGLDLSQGAFGADTLHRPDLVAHALDAARQRRGRALPPGDVLMFGDTVLDVEAARSHGARVVAVATGEVPASALREAGADLVLPDLVDLLPAMDSHPTLKGFL